MLQLALLPLICFSDSSIMPNDINPSIHSQFGLLRAKTMTHLHHISNPCRPRFAFHHGSNSNFSKEAATPRVSSITRRGDSRVRHPTPPTGRAISPVWRVGGRMSRCGEAKAKPPMNNSKWTPFERDSRAEGEEEAPF